VTATAPSNAATPRELIYYDFHTTLRVPPARRLVLWLMIGLSPLRRSRLPC